jgi:hypothetical protein
VTLGFDAVERGIDQMLPLRLERDDALTRRTQL